MTERPSSRVRHSVAVLLAALVLVAWTDARSELPPPPNIVLFTIDTLRADRIGAYGYRAARTPALDALAGRGARFERAVAHAPLTVPSHVSILTGRYPSTHGARDNGTFVLPPRSQTVAALLRNQGYRTAGFVASFLLSSEYGFDQGFQHFDDELPAGSGPMLDFGLRRSAAEVASRVNAWLETRPPEPFFVWIHFYDPHAPYTPPPAFRGLPTPYDGAVAAADDGVGAIVKKLDSLGLRDRTAIVATADHGEGLGDHGEREHGLLLFDSVLSVPLIIATPRGRARVVRHLARHVDLLPTMLVLSGQRPPSNLPGHSLVDLALAGDRAGDGRGETSYAESWYGRQHFGWSALRAIHADEWKYIDAPKPRLFDIRRDPGESHDRSAEFPAVVSRLRGEAVRLGRTNVIPAPDSSITPSPEAAARLRSLGYVSGPAPVTGPIGKADADPADMLPAFEKYVTGLDAGLAALQAQRPDTAVATFAQLVAAYPASYEARHYLGYAQAAANRPRDAVREYARALALEPAYAPAHFDMAKALAALGQHGAARAALDRGFALEPRSLYGRMIAGVVAWSEGDLRAAVAQFARAVQLSPGDPRAHANLAESHMRVGDYGAAKKEFQTLVELKFAPAAAHFNLGVIAEKLGDTAEARKEYRQALSLDPSLAQAREALNHLR